MHQQFQGKRSRSEAWCDCLDVFEGVSTIEGKLRMRRNGTRATRSTKNSTESSKRWQSLGVRGTGNGKWWRVGFEKALRAWIFVSVVVRGGAWAGGVFAAGDESEEERVQVRRMARLSAGAWVRNAGGLHRREVRCDELSFGSFWAFEFCATGGEQWLQGRGRRRF